MKKFKLGRFWPLLLLMFMVLFPFEWLGTFWPEFNVFLNTLFPRHAIGHATIFTVLGLLLLFYFPALRTRPLPYLGLILLAAIGEEGFQLTFKQRLLAEDDFRDIAVDLIAASVVFTLVWLGTQFAKQRQRTRSS